MLRIKHSNGETYEGTVVQEDEHRIWLRIGTDKVLCIMKLDIRVMS